MSLSQSLETLPRQGPPLVTNDFISAANEELTWADVRHYQDAAASILDPTVLELMKIESGQMRVRPIEERDLESVRLLRNRAREWFFDTEAITAAAHRAWFESLGERAVAFYVIEIDERVVGTISVTSYNGEREIGNVLLEDAYQGRGIMSRALAEIMSEPGHYYARVKPNNCASLRLFEEARFERRYLYLDRDIPG
jgi:RimJ/RimL family protein N-acetyltransferase